MKFSVRQILASAAGAVIAAVIASTFGVKGTIIGVAIGSAAATLGTALVTQSIERGHEAVRQVVERAPDSSTSTLLRRLGSTDAAGAATAKVEQVAPTEVVERVDGVGPVARTGVGVGAGARDETVQMEATSTPVTRTQRLEASAITGAPATERLVATASAVPPARTLRWSWRTIAATAGIVFVLALLFVTAIELISGKPMSDIFGVGSGTSVGGLFNNQSPGSATSTTTTSTPGTTTTRPSSSSTTSTSTTTAPTSTTTTAPTGASSTTTSAPPTSGTSTTVGGTGASSGAGSTTTSTSVPG